MRWMTTGARHDLTRRRGRTARQVMPVLLVAALVLVACGNDPPETPTTDAPEAPAPPPEPPPEPPPAPDPDPADEPEDTDEPPAAPSDGAPELLWAVTHDEPIATLAVAPDGQHLAVGERATYLHQLADGRLTDVLVHDHSPEDLAYAPDGDTLAVGLTARGVTLVDPATGEELASIGRGNNNRVAYAPDGSQLAVADRSGVIGIFDGDGSDLRTELDAGHDAATPLGAAITALAYHPDGVRLVAVQWDDCVTRIWDTDAGEVLHTVELDATCGMATRPVALSPDGASMVGPADDGGDTVLRVWDVDTAATLSDLPFDEQVYDVAFGPDGALVAVAARPGPRIDGQVHIVDPAGNVVRHVIDPATEPEPGDFVLVTAVAVSLDGGHVALGRQDGVVEVWRLPGADVLVAPEPEPCEPLPIPSDVLFDTGSAELRAEADAVLDELAGELATGFPTATLTFVGHTDSRGSAADNQALSEARGAAVAAWFEAWAADAGVDGWEVVVAGRGDTDLLVADVDQDGNFLSEAGALNRRVEIAIDAEGCA